MPIIPTYQDRRGVQAEQAPVADINPERYGSNYRALANLGEGMSGFGNQLMTVRKRADDIDASSNAYMNLSKSWQDTVDAKKNEFGKLNEDGTVDITNDRGYADHLHKVGEEKAMEIAKALPSGDAQKMFMQRANGMLVSGYSVNSNYQNITIAQTQLLNSDNRVKETILRAANQPDPTGSALKIAAAELATEYSLGSSKTADGLSASYSAIQAREHYVSSMNNMIKAYAQGFDDPVAGLAWLTSLQYEKGKNKDKSGYTVDERGNTVDRNGKIVQLDNAQKLERGVVFDDLSINGGNGRLSDFISQDEYRIIKSRFESQIDSNKGIARDEANRVFGENVARINNGQSLADYSAMRGSLQVLMQTEPEPVWRRKAMQMIGSVALSEANKEIANAPLGSEKKFREMVISQFNAAYDESGLPQNQKATYAAQHMIDIDKNISEWVKKAESEYRNDPVKYRNDHNIGNSKKMNFLAKSSNNGNSDNPGINKQYDDALIAYQKYKGSKPENYKLMTNADAASIANKIQRMDPDKAGAEMLRLQKAWGDNAGIKFNQLTGQKNGLPEEYLGSLTIGSEDYADAAIENLRNPKGANDLLAGNKEAIKYIDHNMPNKIAAYFESKGFARGQIAKNSKTVSGIQKTLAHEAKVRVAGGEEPEEAMDIVVNKYIGESYGNINGAVVPNRIGRSVVHPQFIKREMDYKSTEDYIRDNVRGVSPDWAEKIANDDGMLEWRSDKNLTRGTLFIKSPILSSMKARDPFVPAEDKKGNKITVDYAIVGRGQYEASSGEIDREYTGKPKLPSGEEP